MTDTKLQIQKGHRTPSKIYSKPKGEKKKLPRYMRGRGKVKEKNSEDSQRRRLLSYRG